VTINTICYLDNNSFQFFYRFHCIWENVLNPHK
jgi:hypothetical protein